MSGAVFKLSFEGGLADDGFLEGYDAAVALRGFERTLALTTHAVLNGKIIVQAPALKGANILFTPPQAGSWEITAVVLLGAWALNKVDKNSPIGHLLYSAYDYVIHSATGATLDYDKSIRQLIEEGKATAPEASKQLSVDVLDGVIERVENSIVEIHRPLIESETAAVASISHPGGLGGSELDLETYEFISRSIERDKPEKFEGAVSSYNINSYTGRMYIPEMHRTVPFILSESIRRPRNIDRITSSLRANALKLGNETFPFEAIVMESVSKRVKRFVIFDF